jgi:hypothetical protein
VSHSTGARVWAEHEVKPWQVETFKFSTDPQLDAKVRYVVGLYLDPPAHAVVLGLFPTIRAPVRAADGRLSVPREQPATDPSAALAGTSRTFAGSGGVVDGCATR